MVHVKVPFTKMRVGLGVRSEEGGRRDENVFGLTFFILLLQASFLRSSTELSGVAKPWGRCHAKRIDVNGGIDDHPRS